MMPARLRALAIVAALLIGTAITVAVIGRQPRALPPRPPNDRPALLLLTSLPIVFGEQFSLGDGGSPALTALSKRYRVLPIGVASGAELARAHLLLMAHPAAQPPEDLVALDDWVRRGGRVLLLADPLLEWPSSRPLGDPLRPAPMFTDTGLLNHWGLRLDAPDRRGREPLGLAGYNIMTDSPGRLAGGCDISRDALVAHCRIGKGRATVVADADLLDPKRLGTGADHNLDALMAELAELERT
jgi:hypothetical protein